MVYEIVVESGLNERKLSEVGNVVYLCSSDEEHGTSPSHLKPQNHHATSLPGGILVRKRLHWVLTCRAFAG